MEINPWGVLIALGLVVLVGIIICMGILLLLKSFKILHFKTTTGFIAWSIIGGIVLTILFWSVKCNCNKTDDPVIETAPLEIVNDSIGKK